MAEDTHETKIVISGDAKNAVSAFGAVVGALNKVRTVVNGVIRAFGFFGLAVQGIQLLIAGYKKLVEWSNRAKVAAQKLREEYEKARYETAVKKAAAAYEQLNKKIAQAIELERKRNQLLDERKRVMRDQNDAKLELSKQNELAALDADDPEYAKKKREIERRYERAEAQFRNGRAEIDAKAQANRTSTQAAQKEREVRELEKQYKRQQGVYDIADANFIAARNRAGFGSNGYRGSEEDIAKAKEAEKAMRKEGETLDKIAEAIKKAREEAEQLRKIAAEQMKGVDAARTRAEADKLRIDNAEKEEAAQEKREAEKKEEAAKKKEEAAKRSKYRLEDAELERDKQKEIAELDPNAKDYSAQKSEIERRYAEKKAQVMVERADETDRPAAAAELEAQKIENDISQREEQARKNNERAGELEAFASRIDSADSVSGNRLTAMGLGSGVSAKGDVASDVKKLVDLLRQDVEANKKAAEQSANQNTETILGE